MTDQQTRDLETLKNLQADVHLEARRAIVEAVEAILAAAREHDGQPLPSAAAAMMAELDGEPAGDLAGLVASLALLAVRGELPS